MRRSLFLQEVISKQWAISEQGAKALDLIAHDSLNNIPPEEKLKPLTVSAGGQTFAYSGGSGGNVFGAAQSGSVAIIPIQGIMMKYSDWWWYGMDDMAELIRMANASDNIAGIVLHMNSPGGCTDSIYQLEDAIRNGTKPIVSFVDGEAASGAMYTAALTNATYALNRMCHFGSIGVMASLTDYSGMEEKWGIKTTVIYPPESDWKNKTYTEALEGKPERMISENLSPWAIHFQNIVKDNRPGLDTTVEGILAGRMFYAYDAVRYGLIDGIASLEVVVEKVLEMAGQRDDLTST